MTSIPDEWAEEASTTAPPATDPDDPAEKNGESRKKGAPEPAEDEPPPLVYPTVAAFMTDWLAPVIRRKLDGQTLTWCPRWWAHPEVLTRINALWRAWEHLRLDPAVGMSQWFLHHCDPHLREIMNADAGPLAKCSVTEGHETRRPLPPLPLEEADPQMWLDPAFSADTQTSVSS